MSKFIFTILLGLFPGFKPHEALALSPHAWNPSIEKSFISQSNESGYLAKPERIIKVPAEFPTIAKAVEAAKEGDWIIISPGKYFEKKIELKKSITISSEWKLTGDESKIEATIIDSEDESLFTITANGVEISGLHMINGNHTLDILANVTVMYNHFVNNLDAISFEGSGGGYIGYNTIENDRDDGIDLDIQFNENNKGSNVLVEHNTIINSNDDGIEIRLFNYPDQNIKYVIRENTIMGSKNAGIQIISYDKYTGKEFMIHHNIISGCKTGLGCMEGSNTVEDLSGASKMDEMVYFFNNTLVDNQMGATGGNAIVAINNLVQGNALGGFKKFGKNSAVINNLFYRNGGDEFIELDNAVTKEGNIFSLDPLLDKTSFMPALNSPTIDAGIGKYVVKDIGLIEIPVKYISGSVPDIGAIAYNAESKTPSRKHTLIVDAGEDMVLVAPANDGILRGRIIGNSESFFDSYWKLDKGIGKVEISNPNKIQTKVKFHQNGIYQFSLVSSDGKQTGFDKKTIRYIADGDGKKLFLKEQSINMIEAEDYSYSYGNTSVMMSEESSENKYIKMDRGDAGQKTFLEYSVGISENADIFMWLLVKNVNSRKSPIQIKFNNQELESFSVSNNRKWNWIKVPGKLSLTAGQWPILIRNDEGSILVDKILFSFDPRSSPKRNILPK